MTISRISPQEYEQEIGEDKVPETELADEAYCLLRYSRLQTVTTSEKETYVGLRGLVSILKEHEISFYRPEDIERYQEETIHRATRRNRVPGWFALSFVILGLLSIPVCAVMTNPWHTISGVALTLGIVGAFVSCVAWGRITATWESYPLAGYAKDIPTSAIEKAVALKKAAPNVSFHIEELKRERVTLDPMLFVSLDESQLLHHPPNTKLCIAIWDEPKFKAPLKD